MADAWQTGKTIGRYQLQRVLGRGGAGEVWLARDPSLDRLVAIKLLIQRGADSESVERFAREARALARLQHSSIVTVFDVGREGDTRYITMEYVEGLDLGNIIRRGPTRISWGVRVARQITSALMYAHQNGVVHRDIKPSNILVARDDSAKLSDFGLAKGPALLGDVTVTGAVLGTMTYMAPEQLSGHDVGALADIFSLGATLYHLFTGRPPREPSDLPGFLAAAQVSPQPPTQLRTAIPGRLDSILLEMLVPDPKRRLQSLDRLAQVLDAIIEDLPSPQGDTLEARAIERVAPSTSRRSPASTVGTVARSRDELSVIAQQTSAGFFDATVFPKTKFFEDESVRFSKIQETLEFYRAHLNNEYLSLLRQATLTYRLWLACVGIGFLILIAGVGAMLAGRVTEGAATAVSTIIVYFIQRVFQQREDHYRTLAMGKNAHLEYGNQWLLVIQSIDSIEDPRERASRQSRLVEVLTQKLGAVASV